MRVRIISEPGIQFEVELDKEERENIKHDFKENLDGMKSRTVKRATDEFLEEIKKIL